PAPATDPGIDETPHALMSRRDEAADDRVREALGRRIDAELRTQLMPTWRLMWQGIRLLRELPEGARVAERWAYDRRILSDYAAYLAEDGRPQARRDQAVGAARKLARMEDALTRYEAERAYDDPLVMADHELTGRAFTGRIVARDLDRTIPGARKGLRRPTVVLRTDERPRLPVGTAVKSPVRAGQKAEILDVAERDGGYETVIQLNGGFGAGQGPPPPGTVPDEGEELTYTSLDPSTLVSRLPAEEDTPWTHGGPPQPYEPTPEDAEEIWE
ncbi:hypothetical protein ACFW15_14710, partial [Streptomyces sp. NPDC058953]